VSHPAERFARAEAARSHPLTSAFADAQRFDLDPFQIAGCHALEAGRSVLVAAPTGAGKTIVGEFAVHLAMQEPGEKAFYTTPMKALSNQKFRELQDVYGESEVGLLTGDTNINGSARIVVMTTEVLRNMLYADSPALRGLRYVVMDEVHYLADRFRGAVWEEVIIHLPPQVRLVSLSATVSNAEEFGDWLDTVRGDTEVIVSETRPVPLEQHVLVRGDLLPLFDDRAGIATAQVNQELMRIRSFKGATFENNRRVQEFRSSGGYEAAKRRPHKGGRRPVRSANVQRIERIDRPEVVELLGGRNPSRPTSSFSAAPGATAPSSRCDGPASGSRAARSATRSARSSMSAPARCRTRTSPSSGSGSGARTSSAASPPTTRGSCPPSRRSSRSSSSENS